MKFTTVSLQTDQLEELPDLRTDPRLLPEHLCGADNAPHLRHIRSALKIAIKNCLTPSQRSLVLQHYWQGLSQSEIARRQGTSAATVCRSLEASRDSLRRYMEPYLQICSRSGRLKAQRS